jgi:hypothetical protein
MYQGTVFWQVAREVSRVGADTNQTGMGSRPCAVVQRVAESRSPEHRNPGTHLRRLPLRGRISSDSDLAGATVELQRFTEGAWMPLAQEPGHSFDPTIFFVKMPASQTALRAVVKTPTVTCRWNPRRSRSASLPSAVLPR